MNQPDLSLEELKKIVSYDPLTGIFVWKTDRSFLTKAGAIAGYNSCGYRKLTINYIAYYAHRLAWFYYYGTWPSGEIDHKNLNRNDNSISNLREASSSQNKINKKSYRVEGNLKGAHWQPTKGKWRARIGFNKKQIALGVFPTAELAHEAYCKAAEKYFGEFARAE